VNTDAEACYVCHSKPDLPVDLTMQELTREYVTTDGKRVLGLINPIKNEPDCYNAALSMLMKKIKKFWVYWML